MKHTSLRLLIISTMLISVKAFAAENPLQVPESLGKVAEIGDVAAEKASGTAKDLEKSVDSTGLPDLSSIPALPKEAGKEEKAEEKKKTDSLTVPPPVALPIPAAAESALKKEDKPAESTKTAEEATKTAENVEKLPPLAEPAKTIEATKSVEPPTSASLPSMTLPLPGSFPSLTTDGQITDTAQTAATPAEAQQGTTPSTAGEKPEPVKKIVQKKNKKPVDLAKRYKNRLPDTIYARNYPKGNKHLPLARYEQDLDAQVFQAIKNDNINGLRALLDYSKRNINKPNAHGDTPLIAAVKSNAINSARLLIGRKADMSAVDAQGLTALDNANKLGLYRIARALTIMSEESTRVAANTSATPAQANAFSPIELTQQ